ncbi:MAG: zinc-ribbon domain-containing protein, partial [Candidatus Hodarchaeota archaeon]
TRDKIIGKKVINSKADIIGTVKDISFNLVDGEIILTVTTTENTDIDVSSNSVSSVGDLILLKTIIDEQKKPEVPTAPVPSAEPPTEPPAKPSSTKTPGLCPACSYQNESSNKFCIKCGSKL